MSARRLGLQTKVLLWQAEKSPAVFLNKAGGKVSKAYTSRFRNDVPNHTINRTVTLPIPTNDQLELVAAAVQALRSEWRENGRYHYKKAGVIMWNISPDTAVQTVLFDSIDRAKQTRLSAAIDAINRRNGFNTVKVAVQGTDKRWHLKCEYKSAQYSTNLREVIKVKV